MIVAIWAVLSCGAQYVPLDGGVVPDETVRRVLDQAEGIVLCLASTKHRITTQHPNQTVVIIDEMKTTSLEEDAHIDLATPNSGCYVIYTSGMQLLDSSSPCAYLIVA
jgi:acyl-coenzyme A synthetase/AMP-(fatty) acid ligase